jgi:hypothetical protein
MRTLWKGRRGVTLTFTEEHVRRHFGIIAEHHHWSTLISGLRSGLRGLIFVRKRHQTTSNKHLIVYQHPIPTPDDIFDKFVGCNIICGLDLSQAYLQLEVNETSKLLLVVNPVIGTTNGICTTVSRLREYNVKLNVEKSEFFVKSITFVGSDLSGKGKAPSYTKVQQILSTPEPSYYTELLVVIVSPLCLCSTNIETL